MNFRVFWLDMTKVTAIIMVILAHVLWIYEQGSVLGGGLSLQFLTINGIIASLGVPFFTMVSGALLFRKQFASKKDVFYFYRNGLLPLLLTAEIWITIYCFLTLRPFSFWELLLCMTFSHKPEVHLWYVRVILIYYLMLPLFCWLRSRWKSVFMALLLVVFTLTFLYNGYLIWKGDACPTNSNRSYFCYLVYMAIGYKMSHARFSKGMAWGTLALTILGGYVLYLTLIRNSYFLWYDNPILAIMAMCLFYLIRCLFPSMSERKCFVEVSKMSYGIYLSHFVLIYVVGAFLRMYACSLIVFYISLFAVLGVDAFLIFVVKKFFPKVSKVLFRY